MKLPPLLDPDRDILSVATLQHFVFSFLLCAVLDLVLPTREAFLWTVVIGFVYEAGQWDTARGLHVCHEGGDLSRPFVPGYGIGLLDLVADALGAALWWLVRVTL